jgi:hypothetical protein
MIIPGNGPDLVNASADMKIEFFKTGTSIRQVLSNLTAHVYDIDLKQAIEVDRLVSYKLSSNTILTSTVLPSGAVRIEDPAGVFTYGKRRLLFRLTLPIAPTPLHEQRSSSLRTQCSHTESFKIRLTPRALSSKLTSPRLVEPGKTPVQHLNLESIQWRRLRCYRPQHH